MPRITVWYAAVHPVVRAAVLSVAPQAEPLRKRRQAAAEPECLVVGTRYLQERMNILPKLPLVVYLAAAESRDIKAAARAFSSGAEVATSPAELAGLVERLASPPRFVRACHDKILRADPDDLVIRFADLIGHDPQVRFHSLCSICRILGTSPSSLHRAFERSGVVTPYRVLLAFRIAGALDVAARAKASVLARDAGYSCERSWRRSLKQLGLCTSDVQNCLIAPEDLAELMLDRDLQAGRANAERGLFGLKSQQLSPAPSQSQPSSLTS